MSEAVEWALHSCVNLAWVEPGQAVSAAKLAAFYDLPPAYLNKQLQALVRAGILSSTSGPGGGFRLARAPKDISLMDVVTAIEGSDEIFRCQQILRQGPGGDPKVDYRKSCLVSQAVGRADLAWRRELAAQSIEDLKTDVQDRFPSTPGATRSWFANLRP